MITARTFVGIMLLISITACQPAGGGKNLKPAQKTNQVAIANLRLGIAYLERKEYEKSLEKLQRAQEADPNYTTTYNVLGLLYQQLRDYSQAEKYFKKALSLNPNDSSTLNNYGQLLCQQNRPDEADKIFLEAGNNPLYETPELAYTNAGLCAEANNKKELAENYFRKALQLNPRMPQALLKMAEYSFNQQNALSARAYLQRYQEVGQHNAKSLWLGIRIERQLGDKNAISSYGLLLKNQFPDSREAQLYQESMVN